MSREWGSPVIPVALFIALLLMALPVSADNNTTQTTATPTATITTTQTTATPTATITATQTANATPTVTVTTTQTANATPTATVTATRTTVIPTATTVAVTQPATTIATATPTIWVSEPPTTGNLIVYSSPPGASILIDGSYYGITPGTVNGVSAGNHILRLSLSGYYDYEGSIYVVPGQTEQGYGTLQPLSQFSTAAPTTVPTVFVPVIVPVVTATGSSAADSGLLNSAVIAAIIGSLAIIIGSAVKIFVHVKPPKRE